MNIAYEFLKTCVDRHLEDIAIVQITDPMKSFTEQQKNERMEKMLKIVKESKTEKEILEKMAQLS